MNDTTFEFWFDFASTYSYLSVCRVSALVESKSVSISWKPFLLGPIFGQQGWNNSPFVIFPAKGRYMWRDMERRASKFRLPFRKPTGFPRNGLTAARIALLGHGQPWEAEFIKLVFQANFEKDLEISDTTVLIDILNTMGLDSTQIMNDAGSDEIKIKLKQQTEIAVKSGVFGSPSFIANGELFWGDDRLEDMLAFLLNDSSES